MCNERERLIEYVYDECDAQTREAVEQHLESCAECRAEIAALRRVRQDLLAWDVPDHGSVWQPFTPPRAAPSWRDVPAWALAAAASLLLVGGAAGGAVTYAFLPRPAAVVAATPQVPAAVVAMSPADLSALEQRVLATMHTELEARAHTAAAVQPVSNKDGLADLRHEIAQLRSDQLGILNDVNADMGRMGKALQPAMYQVTAGR